MNGYRSLNAIFVLIVLGVIAAIGSAQRSRFEQGPDRVGFLGVLRSVRLDRQQEHQIEDILKNNETEIQSDRRALAEARCAYEQGVIAGSTDLTTLAGNLAAAQSNHTSLETTVLGEVAKVLTAEQIGAIASASCSTPAPK